MKKGLLVNIAVITLFSVSMLILFFLEYCDEKAISASVLRSNVTVVVDAGHGGEDGGAVGRNGILEKEINLEISRRLEMYLNLFGINTDMLRRSDDSLGTESSPLLRRRKIADMKKRLARVENTPNAVLLSIHQNSFPADSSCCGAQVFFSPNNTGSEELAESVQSALAGGIDKKNKRKIKKAGKEIYLLYNAKCPAILIECGFLTNPEEAERLMNNTYRTKIAACIVSGFLKNKG